MDTLRVRLTKEYLFLLHIPEGNRLITKSRYGQNQYYEKIYITLKTENILSKHKREFLNLPLNLLYQFALSKERDILLCCVIMTKTGTLTNNNEMKIKGHNKSSRTDKK